LEIPAGKSQGEVVGPFKSQDLQTGNPNRQMGERVSRAKARSYFRALTAWLKPGPYYKTCMRWCICFMARRA
jgi:hypothetical protein